MADFHSTGKAARATGPVAATSSANASKDLSKGQVTEVSARNCPEPAITTRRSHPAGAPVAPPLRHDGPEVAKCLGEIVSRLRSGIQLRREEAAYRAWISADYWYAIERGRRLPSLAVFIMLSRSLGLDPRELLDGLLKRMHHGYGAPPVFQPSVRELSTESEREFKTLMDAVRGKCSEAA
jgi:transcriptional regulator with XRE-family HTH domain